MFKNLRDEKSRKKLLQSISLAGGDGGTYYACFQSNQPCSKILSQNNALNRTKSGDRLISFQILKPSHLPHPKLTLGKRRVIKDQRSYLNIFFLIQNLEKKTSGNININDTSKVHIDSSSITSTLEKFSVGQNLINPFMFLSKSRKSRTYTVGKWWPKNDHDKPYTSMNENANNQIVDSIKATSKCADATHVDNLVPSPYHSIPSTYTYDMCNSVLDNNVEQNVPFLLTLNGENTRRTIMEILLSIENQNNFIIKEQSIIKLVQDRLLNKINGLELNIQGKKNNSNGSSVHLDSDFLSKCPLNDSKYFIKNVGGSNSKNHVQRMMGKFFNDEYATKCTRTGRGKDKTTTVGQSELLNVLKRVLKYTFFSSFNECSSGSSVEFTDSNFENIKEERFGTNNSWALQKNYKFGKKKHDTCFNQLQPENFNNYDPSPIINVTTISSNPSSVLPNNHSVEYPLKDTFTIENNTTFNVLNISSDNPIGQNVQPYSIDLKDKIRSWILHHKVSHNCANSILKIMKSEGLQVPSDVRTLMKTPQSHEIVNMDNGAYIHIGLEKMLTPILKKYFNKIDSNIVLKLGINIDGLPISKCSKSQL
ncbi:hypothetical protein AGLY_015813 [Aphis glycines]|uniref:Uncharacterized protein n=1 Tax=Aphis glycines TaxID=307491 RepID=A0A6G0SZF3_APHGL|nr:hypothetical protein AGLY_015813 [Aphis glycines]